MCQCWEDLWGLRVERAVHAGDVKGTQGWRLRFRPWGSPLKQCFQSEARQPRESFHWLVLCEREREIEVVGRNAFPHETSSVFIDWISCCKYSLNAHFPYLSFSVSFVSVLLISHRSWWRERGRKKEMEKGRGKAHNAVMPISEISRTLSDLTHWQQPLRDYNENVWQGCVCVSCVSV